MYECNFDHIWGRCFHPVTPPFFANLWMKYQASKLLLPQHNNDIFKEEFTVVGVQAVFQKAMCTFIGNPVYHISFYFMFCLNVEDIII